MNRGIFWLLLLTTLGVGGFFGTRVAIAYWKQRTATKWRTAEVTQGNLVSVVNSTGSIKPMQTVHIGSFVSGPIDALYVDFNQEVKKGQMLAKIDPRIYLANVARDRAQLATREADVQRVSALLQQSKNDEQRAMDLRAENPRFISQAEIDQVRFGRQSLEAQLSVAEATVEQARAALENSEAQLEYAKIASPVDGIIIDRKADPGQTLAAQFQTPELFTIGVNMRGKMHVFASVDEADIGLIRRAKEEKKTVEFTVDAYPDDLFVGEIEEIRFSSTTTQNVVTYPVVVGAPNPDLKLLPGMTASLSFGIDDRIAVKKVPNAALRFYPAEKFVRKEDLKLLEGKRPLDPEEDRDSTQTQLSASEKSQARRSRNRRHVWIQDGEFLKAVEIIVGISDSQFTELVEGPLEVGNKLVTGIDKSSQATR